jgi:hypothetical protein
LTISAGSFWTQLPAQVIAGLAGRQAHAADITLGIVHVGPRMISAGTKPIRSL